MQVNEKYSQNENEVWKKNHLLKVKIVIQKYVEENLTRSKMIWCEKSYLIVLIANANFCYNE